MMKILKPSMDSILVKTLIEAFILLVHSCTKERFLRSLRPCTTNRGLNIGVYLYLSLKDRKSRAPNILASSGTSSRNKSFQVFRLSNPHRSIFEGHRIREDTAVITMVQ